MADRKLQVVLTGDSSALERSLSRGEQKVKGFGSAGLVAGAAIAGGLGLAIKDVVGDFLAGDKAASQTAAVIKSTGGAAGVTSGQVADLAGAIADKSGIDDAAVQSGENMLLTFTNIRNEAGAGKDVFNQTTQTLADMSTAMGTDMKTQAIQLGKALNDPIKGISALSKVGVTFTDQQKAQIAAMMKAGDTAGAQKVILAELHKEFGGSADAAGKTLGGQLSILHGKLDNMGGVIVAKVIPVLTAFVGLLSRNTATITTLAPILGVIVGAWLAYEAATKVAAIAQTLLNLSMEANPIGVVILVVAALAAGMVLLYQHSATARAIINGAFGAIKSAASTALGWITHTGIPAVIGAYNSVKPIVTAFAAAGKVAFDLYAKYVRTLVSIIGPLMRGDFSGAFNAAKAAVGGVLTKVGSVVTAIPGALRKALPDIGSAALDVGAKILSKIISGIGDLAGKVAGIVKDAVRSAANFVIDKVNRAVEVSATVDPHIPGFGKIHLGINPPDIPHLAKGGIVTGPTLALIGEAGPEMVTPLGRGGAGGVQIHVHTSTADADPQAIAWAAAWALRSLPA